MSLPPSPQLEPNYYFIFDVQVTSLELALLFINVAVAISVFSVLLQTQSEGLCGKVKCGKCHLYTLSPFVYLGEGNTSKYFYNKQAAANFKEGLHGG